jgi:hypothetical protein
MRPLLVHQFIKYQSEAFVRSTFPNRPRIAGAAAGMNFPDASNGKQPELHI